MRTFIAITLQEEVKQILLHTQQQCHQMCRKGNFTEKENFHMTLHFLGEIASDDIEDLKQAMYETAIRNNPFSMKLHQIGFFERGETAVIWAGVEKNNALFRLHEGLQRSLTKQGFARDRKKLSPHITLARQAIAFSSFSKIQKSIQIPPTEIQVDSITLFESVRIGSKLVYKPLFVQKLNKSIFTKTNKNTIK